MKTRLLAINESCAIYKYDSGKRRDFNPYDFIDGLLSIRTANNLVDFMCLDNTAKIAIPVFSFSNIEHQIGEFESPTIEPLYSKGKLLGAADRHGVEYLDAVTDTGSFIGHFDAHSRYIEALTEWINGKKSMPSRDDFIETVSVVDLSFLKRLKYGLQTLFTFAAIALGDEAPSWFIANMKRSEKEIGPLPYTACSIDARGLCGPLFNDTIQNLDYLEAVDLYIDSSLFSSRTKGTVVSIYGNRGKYIHCLYRTLCGAVVSASLTKNRNTISSSINYSNGHFKSEEYGDDPIVSIMNEIEALIVHERIGLCDVCGLPFVMAYANGRETSSRTTCTMTCRKKKANTAHPGRVVIGSETNLSKGGENDD